MLSIDDVLVLIGTLLQHAWIDDDIDNLLVILIYQLLEYLYIIIVKLTCIIYYRDCTILVYIIAFFILSLSRSLSDNSGFACPSWRPEIA